MRQRLAVEGPRFTRSDGDFERVSIPAADGDVLRDLLIDEQAATVIEIGLAYGASALAIGEALAAQMIQDLARSESLRRRAGDWQTHLDVLLAGSGGVAGEATLGGRPKIQAPPKAVLGAALRDRWAAEGRDPSSRLAVVPEQ